MWKLAISIIFISLFTFSHAQISFYGNSESLNTINSTAGENYLYLSADGNSLYFTREKHPQNRGGKLDRGDLWKSRQDSVWWVPVDLEVNTPHFASPLGFTSSGEYFLYNKVWFDKGLYYGGIFAFNTSDPAQEIQIDIPYFKNRSPLQTGHLSADGRYLLLSMENSKGYGVDDLFVSVLQADGSWSPPKNLGHVVNTRFQEITPFLAGDNKTLIFASNGRGGNGSYDLYVTTRQDDTWQRWSEPKNLGEQVNTQGAETSFMFNAGGNYAYFVSTQNSDGYGDIRRIQIREEIEEEAPEEFSVKISLPDTMGSPLNARAVSFTFLNASTEDSIGVNVIRIQENESGDREELLLADSVYTYSIEYVTADEIWELEFKSRGFLSEELVVGWDELDSSTTRIVKLEPLESGNTITLKNVLFYRGTANFIEGSQRELDLVLEMLQDNPEVNIFLKGHTDNVGNPVMNIQLSQERVRAVKAYLNDAGIEDDRVTGKGFGGSEPIASNEKEETRKLNRRVEFQIKRD